MNSQFLDFVDKIRPHKEANFVHKNGMTEDQIKNLYHSLLESWNQNDASAFASLFTATGLAIGFDGSQMNGREQVEKELVQIFSNHQVSSYVSIIREVRKLSDTVYLLWAVAGMVPPGQREVNSKVNAIHTLIAQKEGDQFKIALFQNTPAAFHGRPELSMELTRELQEAFNAQS